LGEVFGFAPIVEPHGDKCPNGILMCAYQVRKAINASCLCVLDYLMFVGHEMMGLVVEK
jgi:hypothetical protein